MGRHVGALLRKYRRQSGISLRTLAVQMGVTASYLCVVERGERGVSLLTAAQWAETLGMPVAPALEAALQDKLDAAGLSYVVTLAEPPKAT